MIENHKVQEKSSLFRDIEHHRSELVNGDEIPSPKESDSKNGNVFERDGSGKNSDYIDSSRSTKNLKTESEIQVKEQSVHRVSLGGSIFTMIQAVLGAGIITLPYAVYANGLILGPLLIIGAGLVSYYSGFLMVMVGDHFQKQSFQDMAELTYGRRMSRFASTLIIMNLLGVVVAYIVLIKGLIPHTISSISGGSVDGRSILLNEIFWATVATYLVIFPLALFRRVRSLQFSSIMGFCCVIYLTLLVIIEYFVLVENKIENLKKARLFHVDFNGVLGSIPLTIFAYLYQPNIPAIYLELKDKTFSRMNKVMIGATTVSASIYCIFGVMGYMTFSTQPEQMELRNILQVDGYADRPECQVAFIFQCFVVFAASPLCIKPVKDALQVVFWKGRRLSDKANFGLTLFLVTLCYVPAILIPMISDAIQIIGDTSSPLLCFTLPVLFYLKLKKNQRCGFKICFAHFINAMMLTAGVLGLVSFILEKMGIHV